MYSLSGLLLTLLFIFSVSASWFRSKPDYSNLNYSIAILGKSNYTDINIPKLNLSGTTYNITTKCNGTIIPFEIHENVNDAIIYYNYSGIDNNNCTIMKPFSIRDICSQCIGIERPKRLTTSSQPSLTSLQASSALFNNLFGTSAYGTGEKNFNEVLEGDVVSCEILTYKAPFYHYFISVVKNSLYEFVATGEDNFSIKSLSGIGSTSSGSYNTLDVLKNYREKSKVCTRYKNLVTERYYKHLNDSSISISGRIMASDRFQAYIRGINDRVKYVQNLLTGSLISYNAIACNCQTIVDYVLMHYTIPLTSCLPSGSFGFHTSTLLTSRLSDLSYYKFITRELLDHMFDPRYRGWIDDYVHYKFDSDNLSSSNVRCLLAFSNMECFV